MDAVEFARAYNNLRTLIDQIQLEANANAAELRPLFVHIRNAMLMQAAMLDSLNQRVTELQSSEGDDE